MRDRRRNVPVILLVLSVTACGGAGFDGPHGYAATPIVIANGISLNGISLNGISLNGISLNGISLNGISLNGISLNGISLNGTELAGHRLGDELRGTATTGDVILLRIEGAETHPDHTDVVLYTVVYRTSPEEPWRPLCGDRNLALALAGRWDDRQGVAEGGQWIRDDSAFTFACLGSVLAKCVELGYKPWRGLRDHHQACTRMLRADYCGDGTPHTHDGVVLNVYDNLGIQSDTEDWRMEAEWDARGARCVVHARTGNPSGWRGCLRRPVRGRCGALSHFWQGALLMSEHEARR